MSNINNRRKADFYDLLFTCGSYHFIVLLVQFSSNYIPVSVVLTFMYVPILTGDTGENLIVSHWPRKRKRKGRERVLSLV